MPFYANSSAFTNHSDSMHSSSGSLNMRFSSQIKLLPSHSSYNLNIACFKNSTVFSQSVSGGFPISKITFDIGIFHKFLDEEHPDLLICKEQRENAIGMDGQKIDLLVKKNV